MTALPMPPFPAIPSYRITGLIHASDRTLIYQGIRDIDQQPVILKLLRQQPPSLDDDLRLRNHYRLTCNLDLPGVKQPLGLEPYGQSCVLITDNDGSCSLADFLHQSAQQCLPWFQFLPIAIQLSTVLAGLHQHRIVHKEIKPANILIQPQTQHITLIDFGLASQLPQTTQALQTPGLLEGTLAYLSPEQTGRMNRGIDYRSDFYSLGVTFYELLTGQLPFESDDPLELVYCHLAQEPVPPHELAPEADIPVVLSKLVLKLMAKNAEDRYQSALGLKADLERCLEQANETSALTEFALGQIDQRSQFNISQKLYGREAQVQPLLAAFERVSQGGFELVVVNGYSGVGKTALIHEVLRGLTRRRGYFAVGKFDQFQRNIPLAAAIQMFRNLVRQLLTESEVQLRYWRERILAAVGANAQLVIDIIPELQLIIGEQPAVAELGTIEAAHRLRLVFTKFAQVFQSPTHPFVVFMDDLQWADLASLEALQETMADASNAYRLIIIAYRDNEVSRTHPVLQTLQVIRQAGGRITEINLAPLKLEHVAQFVAETLHTEVIAVAPLATLLFEKTAGNPFFLTQLLKSLYEDGLIWFDPQVRRAESQTAGQWQWHLDQIQQREVTDNVVHLMIGKIIRLSNPTQRVLQLAACIGNSFDLQTLATVSQQSPIATAQELWEAIQTGLVVPIGEGYRFAQLFDPEQVSAMLAQRQQIAYRFLHDRVQQAAYTLIPEGQKQETHLRIGQLLLQKISHTEQNKRLLEIVNHLNLGAPLLSQTAEREHLAQLNLRAAQKTRSAAAFAAMFDHVQQGMQLLSADPWQQSYSLTLALHEAAAEAAYLVSNLEQMEQWIEKVLQQAKSLFDQINIYLLKIRFLIAQNQMPQAVATGKHILEQLGFSLENQVLDLSAIVLPELSEIATAPAITDSIQATILKILANITSPAYFGVPEEFPRISLAVLNLSAKFGYMAESATGYGFTALSFLRSGKVDRGYRAGLISLELLKRFNASSSKSQLYLIFNVFIRPHREHGRASLAPLLEGFQSGLETGDLEYASYGAMNYCNHLFFVGEPLDQVQRLQAPYLKQIQTLNLNFSIYFSRIWSQVGINLLRQSATPALLIGENFDETVMLSVFQESKNFTLLFSAYVAKLMLAYWFGDDVQAVQNAVLARQYIDSEFAPLMCSLFYSYESLALLTQSGANLQTEILTAVERNQMILKIWAQNAPMNFQHKYELVEAERHRFLGHRAEAMDCYDRAISGAQENGYIQEAAIANELAAKFYLDLGKANIAQIYLQAAYKAYQHWGARAKLVILEERYPDLLIALLPPALQQNSPVHSATDLDGQTDPPGDLQTARLTSEPSSTVSDTVDLLDLNTILKASQAISQEIQLEQLLTTLMKIVMKNTGAQTGTLLDLLHESGGMCQFVVEQTRNQV